MNTTLHIPVNKEIKERAEAIAKKQGYSSLQEVIRVLVSSLANGELKTTFVSTETITPKQERILNKREKETRESMNAGTAHKVKSADEMMALLEDTSHEHH